MKKQDVSFWKSLAIKLKNIIILIRTYKKPHS